MGFLDITGPNEKGERPMTTYKTSFKIYKRLTHNDRGAMVHSLGELARFLGLESSQVRKAFYRNVTTFGAYKVITYRD